MIIEVTLVLIIGVLTTVYFIGRYNEYYWRRRGVVFHKKNKFAGPIWDFMTQDRPLFEILWDIYKKYPNEPAVGIGSLATPALYVIDPMNVQHVLQNDFPSFSHRGVEITQEDVLADNILFMNGNRWKLMRQHMTPLFTGAKLKNMYYIVDKSAKDFVQYLKEHPERVKGNVFDTLSCFCSAAIGAAVFGVTTASVFDSPFLTMARESVEPTLTRNLKFSLSNLSLRLAKILKIQIFKKHEEFFVGAISRILRQREQENVKKHDFADICLALQKNGTMRDSDTGFELEPTDGLLAAQGFFFFLAGVEPTATAIYGTLIELGRHPDILNRVLEEIDETYEKCNGKMTYDDVIGMEYLDKVISEAMRLHPPIGFNTRLCVKDTVLPVGNIRVDKGTKIFTPIYEMHYDPKFYPDPEVFDPERFDNDPKSGDITYQPFGKGGRLCLGMRYARLQMKAGLLHLLRNYTVKSSVGDNGKLKYMKQAAQVRTMNAEVELIPRQIPIKL